MELSLTVRQVFPYGPVLKAIAVASIAALPMFFVLVMIDSDALKLAAGVALYVPIYLGLALSTGVVLREDLRYLLGFLTGRIMGQAREKDMNSTKPEG